jgi:hypothetical protein
MAAIQTAIGAANGANISQPIEDKPMSNDPLKFPFSQQSLGGVMGAAFSMTAGLAICMGIGAAVGTAMFLPSAWPGRGAAPTPGPTPPAPR